MKGMGRLARLAGLLTPLLAVAQETRAPAALPTAVQALADYQTSRRTEHVDPLAAIEGACRITPAGAAFAIRCASRPYPEPRRGRDYIYSVILFRDLEETLYLAACTRRSALDPCAELRSGLTLTAEVEDNTLRVVVVDQQVPMRILEKRPREQAIDSPTRGTPSQVRASAGTPSAVPYSQVRPSPGTPSTTRHSEAPPSDGAPSRVTPSDIRPAVTSPTGARLHVSCSISAARISVDNRYVGRPPAEVPLLPGKHTVLVQAPGYRNWVQTVEIAAGAMLRLTVELRR